MFALVHVRPLPSTSKCGTKCGNDARVNYEKSDCSTGLGVTFHYLSRIKNRAGDHIVGCSLGRRFFGRRAPHTLEIIPVIAQPLFVQLHLDEGLVITTIGKERPQLCVEA